MKKMGLIGRSVRWITWREALAQGQREGKPVLLHFTSPGSPLCGQMDRETYGDPRVIRYLNEHFALAMGDVVQMRALARRYQVEWTPAVERSEIGY